MTRAFDRIKKGLYNTTVYPLKHFVIECVKIFSPNKGIAIRKKAWQFHNNLSLALIAENLSPLHPTFIEKRILEKECGKGEREA